MLNNIRAVYVNLLKCPGWAISSKRTTYIFQRKNPARLNKLSEPIKKRLKRREYYYDVIQDTHTKKNPLMDVILTTDVAGLGMRGEKVSMNIYKAYTDLLLPKMAVYTTSPEAENIMKVVREKSYSSRYSKIVENYLAGCSLKVIMSNEAPWTLEPWHIKCALRQIGISANDDCISIPNEISGPDLEIENKDFVVYVIMNKSEKFPVRCRIFHWSTTETSLNQKDFDMQSPSEVLFPDEREIIESLQKTEKEIKEKKELGNIKTVKKGKKGKIFK